MNITSSKRLLGWKYPLRVWKKTKLPIVQILLEEGVPSDLIVDFDPEKLERFDFRAYIEGEPQEAKFLRIDMVTSVNRHASSSEYGHTLATTGSKEVIKLPLTEAQNEIIDRI